LDHDPGHGGRPDPNGIRQRAGGARNGDVRAVRREERTGHNHVVGGPRQRAVLMGAALGTFIGPVSAAFLATTLTPRVTAAQSTRRDTARTVIVDSVRKTFGTPLPTAS